MAKHTDKVLPHGKVGSIQGCGSMMHGKGLVSRVTTHFPQPPHHIYTLGTLTYASGHREEGEFRAGKHHGKQTVYWSKNLNC